MILKTKKSIRDGVAPLNQLLNLITRLNLLALLTVLIMLTLLFLLTLHSGINARKRLIKA